VKVEYIVIARTSGCYEVWKRWSDETIFTLCVASCSSSLQAEMVRDALTRDAA
jgi:uncharacterized protein with ATP-grasp and redox domains